MNARHVFKVQLTLVASLLAGCLVLGTLLGCQTAAERQTKRQGKVDADRTALQTNREAQVLEAAKHVYATGLALNEETNRTPPVVLAADLNTTAQVILGFPEVKDSEKLKVMIQGLLSTNQLLQVEAQQQRQALQKEIERLQTDRVKLEQRLKVAEELRDSDYAASAYKAAQYEKWKRRLYWGAGIVGGGLLLSLILPALSVAFPALAPFAAIFNGIFGALIRMIFRVAPKAMTSAGVVGRDAYQLSERTLADVVTAIEQVKLRKPQVFDQALKPALKDATDSLTSRRKIQDIKLRLSRLDTDVDPVT